MNKNELEIPTTPRQLPPALDVVDIQAMGYEWICPLDHNYNTVIGVPSNSEVTCKECNTKFQVADHYHAYN